MEHKDIKDMNKEERLTYAMMLMRAYRRLMLYDIAAKNEYGEKVWKKNFVDMYHILVNMMEMRGMEYSIYGLLS